MPPQVGMLPANAGMQGVQPQMAAIPVQAAGTPGVPSGNASEAAGIVPPNQVSLPPVSYTHLSA